MYHYKLLNSYRLLCSVQDRDGFASVFNDIPRLLLYTVALPDILIARDRRPQGILAFYYRSIAGVKQDLSR